MTPWIQVYSNILTHDKTYALAEALKVPNYAAVGLMVSLWSWAAVNAVDGDITAFPKRAISDATGWEASTTAGRKNSPDIYQSLIDVRLIETVGDRVRIRNWDYYASLLIDSTDWQKEKTKQRVKKHRQRRQTVISPDESGECNVTVTLHDADCNVTDCVTCNGYSNADVTQCNGATVPNHTVKEKYIKENDDYGVTGRFAKPTVGQVGEYCRERGNSVDPAKFVDFYESKGWVVGKSPMKDWRAAVRTWERSGNGNRPPGGAGCGDDMFEEVLV